VLDTTAATYCGSSRAAELIGASRGRPRGGHHSCDPPTRHHPVRRVLTVLGVLHMLSVRSGRFIRPPRTA